MSANGYDAQFNGAGARVQANGGGNSGNGNWFSNAGNWIWNNILKDGAMEGHSDGANRGQSWEDGKKTMLGTVSIIATGGGMAIYEGAGAGLVNVLGTASIVNSVDNITGLSGNINNQNVQLGIQMYKAAVDATSVMTNLRPNNFINGASLILDSHSTYNNVLDLNKILGH